MQHASEICVIGNGAVGKAAALGFALAGHSVTLVAPAVAAPADTVSWDVRVFALNHVAQELLASLRVWDAMDAARVAPVTAMEVRGDGAAQTGRLGFDAWGAHTGALAWIVEDRNLGQALDAALRFAPNLRFIQGTTTAMAVHAEHALLTLDNGDTITAELVVGADGSQSWVRGQCDIDIAYRAYGQRGVVTNFACSKPHRGVAHQWFVADQGIIALLPLPGDRVSLVWSAPEALAQQLLQEPLSRLAQRLAVYCEECLGTLTPLQPEAVRAFPLTLLRAQAITAPRVALVGDAAHVVHPLAGHGMNLGFGDVADLLAAVAARAAQRDCGDARVLSRYARSRKEAILLMQVTTDALERLFGADFEPLRVARNLGMTMLDKLPFLKRRLISHAMGKRL